MTKNSQTFNLQKYNQFVVLLEAIFSFLSLINIPCISRNASKKENIVGVISALNQVKKEKAFKK